MDEKWLRLNAGNTKVMMCGTCLEHLQSPGKSSCTVCSTEVGNDITASTAMTVNTG